MSWQDLVNGLFEIGGGLMVTLHCLTLHRDKQVRGASWVATMFFAGWGWWNLYYYPHLEQWLSFAGGVVIVVANTVWVGMMLYYIRRERQQKLRSTSRNEKLYRDWVERETNREVGPESPNTIP